PEERGKAVGTWVGIAAGGGVLGLVTSGLLLEWFSWPSIFVLNVAPATRALRPPRLDPVGTLISVSALAAFVYGITEAPTRGWGDPVSLAALIAGGVGIVL